MFNKYPSKVIAQVMNASAKKTVVKYVYKSIVFFAAFMIVSASFAQTKNFQQNRQKQDQPQLLSLDNIQNSGILFLENKGQITGPKGEAKDDILFSAKGTGCKFFITKTGLSYQFQKVENPKEFDDIQQSGRPGPEMLAKIKTSTHRVNMRLYGANVNAVVHQENEKTYFENYYNVPSHPEGIRGVKSYGKIIFEEIYPNIDWVIYSTGKSVKYNFIVRPGGDPSDILMQYDFADKLKINSDGSITFSTALGQVTDDAPHCFQRENIVESKFVLVRNTVSFSLGNYNRSQQLVIDPAITWATYFGGTNYEHAFSTAVDGSGNIYMTGYTQSTGSIASDGFQNTFGGANDAFLVKFDTAGTRLWATYFGGTGSDFGQSAAVDSSGNVYAAGYTETALGIASGGFQNTFGGGSYDAFLVKFNGTGSRIWATYYGGSATDVGNSVTIDGSGNVYLTGYTSSTGSIASGGFQNSLGGGYDAFQVKFNSTGSRLWGTYYGGSGYDFGQGSAIDGSGNVYMTGYTKSTTGIASAGGFQNSFGGIYDAFLVKFNSSGSRTWATYYGGAGNDVGNSAAIDASGNVYASGYTTSTDNIASGGFQNTSGGSNDAFVAKFDGSGSRIWATYYGGSGSDFGQASTIDTAGNVCLAGYTNSTSGIASGGFQNTLGGANDAFLVKFNVLGSRIWSSYYGGPGNDAGNSITISGSANLYLAGYTQSTTGIASGGFQNTLGGVDDGFLVKVNDPPLCTVPAFATPTIIQPTCAVHTGSITVNATGSGTLEFSINNGSTWLASNTFNNLATGSYNLVARLQSSPVCVSIYSSNPVIIGAVPTTPAIAAPIVTQPTCSVQSGSIVVNATGSGSLEFSINNGSSWQASNTFSSLASGSYNLVTRIQNSPTCVASYSDNPVVISAVPTAPAITAPVLTQPTCSIQSGTIVANATGSDILEYSINNAASWQASNTFSGLIPGSYDIVIRLQNSTTCVASYSDNPVVISAVPTAPAITAPAITQPNCSVQTGTIVVNATGGGTIEFSVNNGSDWQVSNTFSSLFPDSYNLIVRLQNNPTCTATYSGNPVVINTVPELPVITTPDIIQPDCIITSGTITVNATGDGALEFSIDNGDNWQLSNVFSGLVPGSYNIDVRLQSNPACIKNYNSNPVVINTASTVNTPDVIQPTCSIQTGTIVVNSAGSGILEFSINNGDSWQLSNMFSGLVPGSYNIVVRLQSSPACTENYNANPVVINQVPIPPSATISGTTGACLDATSPNITFTGLNGTAPYTFTYTLNGISQMPITTISGNIVMLNAPTNAAGTFTYALVSVSNSSCSGTASGTATVTVGSTTAPARPGKITGTSTNLCGGGVFAYSVPVVASTLIYNWTVPIDFTVSSGQGTRNVNITVPSNFPANNINVTASNGCSVSAPRSLAVNAVVPNPGGSINGPVTVAANQTNVVYKLPNTAGLTYTWSVPPGASIVTGQGTFRITVNFGTSSGFIRVTVSNACGSSPKGKLQVSVGTLTNTSTSSEKVVISKAYIEVYPNPFSSLATVIFSAQQPGKKYEIIVTDVTGKAILSKSGITNSGENRLQLDMSQYANGMYLLKLLIGNQFRTIKLYKEK